MKYKAIRLMLAARTAKGCEEELGFYPYMTDIVQKLSSLRRLSKKYGLDIGELKLHALSRLIELRAKEHYRAYLLRWIMDQKENRKPPTPLPLP